MRLKCEMIQKRDDFQAGERAAGSRRGMLREQRIHYRGGGLITPFHVIFCVRFCLIDNVFAPFI